MKYVWIMILRKQYLLIKQKIRASDISDCLFVTLVNDDDEFLMKMNTENTWAYKKGTECAWRPSDFSANKFHTNNQLGDQLNELEGKQEGFM